MTIYIVAILVSLVLISILFFALRSTVKRIDYNTKKYFVDKLQDYDYLIEEKQKKLDELNLKIEKNKKELNEKTNKVSNSKSSNIDKYYGDSSIPKYMDENLFKKYKSIKDNFDFNYDELIRKFLNKNPEDANDDYETLVKIKNKFSNNVIFEILKLRPSEQKKYLEDILTLEEKNIFEKYIKIKNKRINDLIMDLEMNIEKLDPVIYVLTGEKNKNYDYISPKIKTIFDSNINEGIKINYKGVIYDYSL